MGLIIRSSAIHAAGCYTTSPIKKGTRVLEYTGPRMLKSVADEVYAEQPYTYLFALSDEKTVIDGHGTAAFINHSCDPNCETEEDDEGRVWIRTLRNISADEELTYDYSLYDGDGEEPCFCGTRHCRGTMYGREEIQKRRRRQPADKSPRKKPSGKKNKTV